MPSVQLDEFLRERPEVNPTIYAYTIPEVEKLRGYIKVGFTDRNVEARIKEQLPRRVYEPVQLGGGLYLRTGKLLIPRFQKIKQKKYKI